MNVKCKNHFFMDTLTEQQFHRIFIAKTGSMSELDLYHAELPLLDVVPYIYNKGYYNHRNKDGDYSDCHILMINDKRFKHVDCRVGDIFLENVFKKKNDSDTDTFVFKIGLDVESLKLYCYGDNEKDNVTSTVFIIGGLTNSFCSNKLGFEGDNKAYMNIYYNKELIMTKPGSVQFIFNPWVSDRTDAYVFHGRMMIGHQSTNQEENVLYFDNLPLGYTAVLIQTNSEGLVLMKILKTNDRPTFSGGAVITY